MSECRITRIDLEWWLEYAARMTWTFARTYAESAPHHYIVAGRTPGVTRDDVVRAARVIHTFGRPGKYYSVTKIYLETPDGHSRWWTEDRHFDDATLVNRATTERLYGIQNALTTATGVESPFDAVASSWDSVNPIRHGEAQHVSQLLARSAGQYPPHVLDIGCGTGRVLDLALVAPARYAGLDSSSAMLNTLIRKHPAVGAIYPLDVRDALASGLFTPQQFDWVFLDSSVELTEEEHAKVSQLAGRALITVDSGNWRVRELA